jgi:hypothetical protein
MAILKTGRQHCATIKTQPGLPMLKKVDSSQLKVGMYIHDLSCDWMTHPFVRNRFLIGSEDEIRKTSTPASTTW